MHRSKVIINVWGNVFDHLVQNGSTSFTFCLVCVSQKVVISRHLSITLTLHGCNRCITLRNDLVQLVLVVDAVVWGRASVHLQVALRSNRHACNSCSHRSRGHCRRGTRRLRRGCRTRLRCGCRTRLRRGSRTCHG